MFKYSIGNKKFKSKSNKDVSLFAINPDCLKVLSKEHRQAFKGFKYEYKKVYLFNVASKFADIQVEKVDGRSKSVKSLKYVSIVDLFESLKDNQDFKTEMLKHLKGEYYETRNL